PVEQALAAIWADVLGVERVGRHDNFFELGGDSILSIQVVSRARQAGLRFSTKELFQHQTVAELAGVTVQESADAQDAPVVGEVPLTPIQRWFFATHRINPRHFNQAVMLELADGLDLDALRRAVEALFAQHDALRARFTRDGEEWRQEYGPVEPLDALTVHALPEGDEEAQAAAMEKIADEVHAGFDLGRGPLLRAVLFDRGAGRRPYLLLVAHHLIVDGVSWRILLDDLDSGYGQAAGGGPVRLGAKTTSVQEWSTRLAQHVASGALDAELDYWATAADAGALPVDHEPAPGAPAAPAGTVTVPISPEDTDALLRAAPGAYRTRINDVLLAALAWALTRWTGRGRVSVQLEGHGREDVLDGVDLSRTVGWFTTMFPVALEVPADDEPDWRTVVKSVRRQLRAVPGNGFGFSALRELGPPEVRERLAGTGGGPQIVFNYLGQWDARSTEAEASLFHAAHPAPGLDHDPADRTGQALEVVGSVHGGELEFSWYYQPAWYDEATVTALAGAFAEALRRIAQDCREDR
ncbi:MAG TPA: condensation domain-containing protein, partial [Pilimelia sp.]|nr:condensation domain-containing protein [Pilimelia sp.]